MTFLPDGVDRALELLVQRMEASSKAPWSTREMGSRYTDLSARIVAFRADVVSLRACFKLGQDESRDVLLEMDAGLEDPVLKRWVRRFNPLLDERSA